MKRRSFVKKSVAAAIVTATPLALTGLVNAAGGGSGSSNPTTTTEPGTTTEGTTGWWTTTEEATTTEGTTGWWTTTEGTTTVGTTAVASCEIGARYTSVQDNQPICWNLSNGYDPNRLPHEYSCAYGVTPCPIIDANSTQAQIAEAAACMALPYGFNKPDDECELGDYL